MAVNAISGLASSIYDGTLTTQTTATANNSTLTTEDFYQLLAAQLKYQDMNSPMSNSEMMDQMTQLTSMSTMEALSDAITNMATVINNMSTVTLTTYSTGLLGKQVTVAMTDANGSMTGKITGIVTGVDLTGSQAVYVDGKAYELSQIMNVGTVSSEGTDSSGDTENTDSTESDNTAEDTQSV